MGIRLILCVCVGVLAWAFLASTTELGEVPRVLERARPDCVGMATVMSLLFMACSGIRLKLALEAVGEPLSLKQALQLTFWSHSSGILLGGPAGGDLAGASIGSRLWRKKAGALVGAIPLNRGIGLIGLLLTGLTLVGVSVNAGALRLPTMAAEDPGSLSWPHGLVAGAVMIGLIAFKRARVFVLTAFQHFLNGLLSVVRRRSLRVKAIGIGVLGQCFQCGVMMSMLKAIHDGAFPWLGGAWVFVAVGAASMIPSLFGLGPRESAAVLLFVPYGIAESEAVAVGLLCGALGLLWGLVGWVGLLLAGGQGAYESLGGSKPATRSMKPDQDSIRCGAQASWASHFEGKSSECEK